MGMFTELKNIEAKTPPLKRPASAGEKPARQTERVNRTVAPNERTDTTANVMTEMVEGVREEKRPTERFSFEIYTDQKPRIEELQYVYRKKTGKKLSSSRILREALEQYLDQAFAAIKKHP